MNKSFIKYTSILDIFLNTLIPQTKIAVSRGNKIFGAFIIKKSDFQGNSVINYPNIKTKFTRIHEPKHLHPERNYDGNKTLIIYEYPTKNNSEPYYPINDNENRLVHRKYKKLSKNYKNFFYGGRLADYAYYDMDMTISAALKLYQNKIKKLFI